MPLGEHGYPPERESMRAIFLADGPAFRDGVVVGPSISVRYWRTCSASDRRRTMGDWIQFDQRVAQGAEGRRMHVSVGLEALYGTHRFRFANDPDLFEAWLGDEQCDGC